MVNRREFLTGLFGAATAAVLLPMADVLASPIFEPLYLKSWDDTFNTTLKEAWRLFTLHHGDPMPEIFTDGDGMKIGYVAKGGTITDQLSVNCDKDNRLVDLAMRSLAERVKQRQLTMLVPLALPVAITFAGHCGGLRMVVAYNIKADDLMTRFDVLGARA